MKTYKFECVFNESSHRTIEVQCEADSLDEALSAAYKKADSVWSGEAKYDPSRVVVVELDSAERPSLQTWANEMIGRKS